MKRRIFAMLLSLAMLFTLAPTAFAADSGTPAMKGTCGAVGNEDSVKWALTQNNDDSAAPTYTLTISGSGNMADFTSPTAENANIAPWYTALPADENTSSVPITEIKIDEGVTDLGNYAFSYLTNVVKVNIPASITSLGDSIFRGDTALTTVEWARDFKAPEITDTDSNSATYTGNYVPTSMFDGCTSLGSGEELSAWLPDSFTGVGCAAFRGTQFTVNFDGWDTLKYIGAYGFAGMPNLDSFTLSGEITLGLRGGASNAFNSSGLKSLTVADGIAVVPSGLCNGCEQLSSVALADSVTTITMYAFFNTKALEKIDLKKVQTIDGYAFWGSGLTDLILPKSVKNVGSRAFEACTSLTKVTINATELTLDTNNTFAGCSSLNTVVTSADSKIEHLNASAFGPDTSYGSKDYKQAPVKSIEINGTVNTLNFSALSSLKSLTINGKNTWQGNALPSGFENLVINGDSWSVGTYQFQGSAPVKHLTVFADNVSAADGSEAAFRSNFNLETAQFTGENVTLQDKMFMGCTNLKWLDLSTVGTLTVGSSCFGDDTSGNYGASQENPNRFNKDCVIYAKDATAAQTLRGNGSGLDNTKGIVLVINGGSVDTTAENAGFSAVTKSGYTAKWYTAANFSGDAVTKPMAGNTYYAEWTMADSISLTSDSQNPVTYGTKVTLTASPVNSSWGYVWYKDVNGNGTLELNTDKQISNNKSTLELTNVSDSGTYWVQVIDGSNTKTSNKVNVTITKADVTNTAKENVHHTFGTTYDVSNLFNIDPNAGNATYTLAENTDENAGTATLEGNILTVTKAGTIKVSLTTAQTDNYNAGNAVTATLTVDKATPAIKISADQTSFTGSGTVKLTVSGAPTEGSVNVTCDNGITVTNNNDRTFTATLPNETKTYTFTASYDGDANHEKASDTCQVSVTRHTSSSSSSNPTYSVTTPSKSENGGVAVSSKNARKGDTVTVTVTPDAGYQVDKLTVTDKNGKELKLTDKGDGKYSFTMPDGKVEVKAVFAKEVKTSPFGDVSTDAYYYKAVQWAQEKGITDGISSNLFGPKQPCTRSQIVTFLWRAAGSPEPKGTVAGMTDVVPGSYYAKAVAWAVENGITTGTAEGTFSPDATCTRAQAVTFLARAQNAKATGKTAFSDVPADSYFADAVAWAQANGVTTGTSETTFSPDNDCTRAQIVTFLYRANQGT